MKTAKRIICFTVTVLMVWQLHAQVQYPYVFNPVGSKVDDTEKPARDAICLNGSWQFMPVYETDLSKFVKPQAFHWESTSLKIPSPWNVNSFAQGDGGDFVTYPSYPNEWEKATMGWMRKEFTLPESWKTKRVILDFEAIAGFAKIYVNGQLAGDNLNIFFATQLDITSLLKEGVNEIVVGVAKASLTDVPGPYGRRNYVAGSFWGQHIAGIWQDVWLLAIPELAISNVFIQPDVRNDHLNLAVTVKNQTAKAQTFILSASVRRWEKQGKNDAVEGPLSNGILKEEVLKIENPKKISLKPGDSIVVNLGSKVEGKLNAWTPETPDLYGAIVSLNVGKNTLDAKYTRFGWRQFTIQGQELLLNGKPIVLKGDSWHFMGVPQMTRRYAWAWFKMLKDANANAVRLHAQPYPSFYLDVADEMGICVLDETGIWSSDGGPKMDSDDYWKYCRKHVKDLVLRDRNHPAVFGWSVCNETLPVVINVFHAPEWIEKRQIDEINQWVKIVRENDSTRDWISGDGEDMRPTDLPVVIGHYGDENSMRKWSSEGKPWGVGETGMGYYGTPRQISVINGNRAYESQQGRMEGLAVEAYRLIEKQQEYKASYTSVFNLVWYGLKPLAFGMKDTTRAPIPEDGIFFPSFAEGVPGMQPERLGPYTSTLNPGYDPSLPLYEPWSLFYAVKAINATPPAPFNISNKDSQEINYEKPATISGAVILASDESSLKEQWRELGIPLDTITKKSIPSLLIVDGNYPPTGSSAKQSIDACLNNGGTVVIWGVSPESKNRLNELLPYSLELTGRKATSLVKRTDDPFIGALNNKDFYFTEITRQPVMQYGLAGEIVKRGKVILEACNTDWSRWNSRPEYLKTAAVYRSEREAKPEGAALIKVQSGKGQLYVTSIDLLNLKSEGETLLRTLLANLGLTVRDIPFNTRRAFASDGNLERAVYLNGRNEDEDKILSMDNLQFITQYESENIEPAQTGMQGFINLSRLPDVRQEDKTVYLSCWIFSPRSLINLLVEPDMPKLSMVVEGQTGIKISLNGKPIPMNGKKLENMPLEKGWNHVLLQFEREEQSRNWQVKVQLESDNPAFFQQIKSSVAMKVK